MTQLGGYRPLVDRNMEREVEGMKMAYDCASKSPAKDILQDLKGMGYRVIDWDGKLANLSTCV